MKKTERIVFHTTPRQLEAMKASADMKGMSLPEWLRWAVVSMLESENNGRA